MLQKEERIQNEKTPSCHLGKLVAEYRSMLAFTEVNTKNKFFVKVVHTFPSLLTVLIFDPA